MEVAGLRSVFFVGMGEFLSGRKALGDQERGRKGMIVVRKAR